MNDNSCYLDGLRPMPPTPDRQGQLSIMQSRIQVLIKDCEDVELILESCRVSWQSFWVMCLPHRGFGHALGAGLASREAFCSNCFIHLVYIWGPIGRSRVQFGVILMSFFTLGVPPGRLLGLRSLFNLLITFGTILGPIFGSFGDLQEPLTPPD